MRVGDQLYEVGRCIEGGCVAGPFDSMRFRSGNRSGERSDEPEHAVGAARAEAAHNGDIDRREIRRGRIAADGVAEVR
jgi:hypothetical protein